MYYLTVSLLATLHHRKMKLLYTMQDLLNTCSFIPMFFLNWQFFASGYFRLPLFHVEVLGRLKYQGDNNHVVTPGLSPKTFLNKDQLTENCSACFC